MLKSEYSMLERARHANSTLQWRNNGRNGISNHQPRDCLLSSLYRHRSKKISKQRVTGRYAGNSPVTDEFPAQMASNTENVSIWWRHHEWYWPCRINTTWWNYPCHLCVEKWQIMQLDYISIFPKINSAPDELNVLQTNRYTEWAPHVRHESSLCDYQ